jgi:hypothetical protein
MKPQILMTLRFKKNYKINKNKLIFTLCLRWKEKNREEWTLRDYKKKNQISTKTHLQKKKTKTVMIPQKMWKINN